MIYGISGGASSPLETDVELPHLNPEQDVTLQILVKSRTADSVNTNHHVRIFVNENTTVAAETNFDTNEPHLILLNVDGSFFVPGKNKLTIEATGQNLIGGEYDMLYVDTIDVFYSQTWNTDSDHALVLNQPTNKAYLLDGLTDNQVVIYDVSSPIDTKRLNNLDVQVSGANYSVEYGLDGSSLGRKLWVGTEDSKLSSPSLKLIYGSELSNTANGANILFIGHRDMLGASAALAYYRETQGHTVYRAALEDIYNEFGFGNANVNAIKDFINFARNNWSQKPSYVILLGDGTYDPKAFQNTAMPYRFPVKFQMGSSWDYGSDNWYVSDENTNLPQEVIARIPAKTPDELLAYVNKVLSYEQDNAKPNNDSSLTFFSDTPLYDGEDFEKPIADIQSQQSVSSVSNNIQHIKRSEKSNAELKTEILQSFNNSSLIHYMGHGAENMWADRSVFQNNDLSSLSNTSYPVVVAMNCLNGHFYDPSLESLGESMVMQENSGAIAFWGSTSLTPPSVQNVYQQAFYDNLIDGQVQNLGDLVKMSKTQAGLSSPYPEVLNSWVILGDPLVPISLDTQSRQDTNVDDVQETAPQTTPSSGGGGCSAFANTSPYKTKTPWDLFFGFVLEILLSLITLRVLGRASQRLNSTEDS
ncbi:MAG: C25 family cysteine peptidase, partial [Bdellovibrionales bacterium]|nr:C25 family cysteine peptidase [Bdellovibrionales bacterium]